MVVVIVAATMAVEEGQKTMVVAMGTIKMMVLVSIIEYLLWLWLSAL